MADMGGEIEACCFGSSGDLSNRLAIDIDLHLPLTGAEQNGLEHRKLRFEGLAKEDGLIRGTRGMLNPFGNWRLIEDLRTRRDTQAGDQGHNRKSNNIRHGRRSLRIT